MSQKMNIPQYNDIINKIGENLEEYETALKERIYTIGLANGDYINIRFPESHIAHLLGVNTDELRKSGIIKYDVPSYEILKKLVDSISYGTLERKMNVDSIFSEYTDLKIDGFINNIKIRSDDIHCIIKYKSDRTYTTGEEKENSDYFIIRKRGQGFMALGVVKTNVYDKYSVPVTARYFKDKDELNAFLNKVGINQEITYPHTFKMEIEHDYITTPLYSSYTSMEDKLKYTRLIKSIASQCNGIPSNAKDSAAVIERFLNSKQAANNQMSILNIIRDNIKSSNPVDKEEVKQILDNSEIPEEIDKLIDACNDLICSGSGNSQSALSYSTIQNENEVLKQEMAKMKEELEQSRTTIDEITQENEQLTEQNAVYTKKFKVIKDAFDSIKD